MKFEKLTDKKMALELISKTDFLKDLENKNYERQIHAGDL